MRIWRISNHADLTGIGGLKVAGRWHEKGRQVVYAADHPSTALLETLVHLEIDLEDVPENFQLIEIDVATALQIDTIDEAALEELSAGWRSRGRILRFVVLRKDLPFDLKRGTLLEGRSRVTREFRLQNAPRVHADRAAGRRGHHRNPRGRGGAESPERAQPLETEEVHV